MGEEARPDDQHALVAQRLEPLAQLHQLDGVVTWAATSAGPGCRPSGYMIFSGTQAPWSRPRLACWWTGSSVGHHRGDALGERGGVGRLVGHLVVLRREPAEVVDQRRVARAQADRRRLPVRADDQDRRRARQVAGQRRQLPRPHRVVEQRRRAVADVQGWHPVGHGTRVVDNSTIFKIHAEAAAGPSRSDRPPWSARSLFTRENGREPKKPRDAESGDGWADSTHGIGPSIGLSDCASRPHRIAAHGPPRAASARDRALGDGLPAAPAVRRGGARTPP